MKRFVTVVVVALAGVMLTGCMSIKQHRGFSDAGSPPDRKATLLIGYDLGAVKIDDQKISLLGRGWGTSAWVVEILPGQHEVEGVWAGRTKLLGRFTAENGRNYAILTDTSSTPLGGNRYRLSLHRAYISVLPVGKAHELSFGERLGFTQSASQKAKKGYKKVADLRLSKEND